MTIQHMGHVAVVVDDLNAATDFFVDLGLEQKARWPSEGELVDGVLNLDGARAENVLLQTPDGHGRIELSTFHAPKTDAGDAELPPHARGIRHLSFEVDDLDDAVAKARAHGGALLGDIMEYEGTYRLCFLRGPEGVLVELAQKIG